MHALRMKNLRRISSKVDQSLFRYRPLHHGGLPPSNISVAVAMSGGIDSAVTALLLKRQGYNISGIFMRNWDASDEAGDDLQCPINQDHEDMKAVCSRLGIPALEVNFVSAYWTAVFAPFVEDFRSNVRTPNPDVSCNAHIKFDKFRKHVLRVEGGKFDFMATGHYVRVTNGDGHAQTGAGATLMTRPRLLRGVDRSKDQSYFLSTTAGENFSNVLFPLGELTKRDVKKIAHEAEEFAGLRILNKKESMGICFVGKRKMSDFLPQYFTPTPGRFIDIDSKRVVGRHCGSELFTVGQKAKIGGAAQKYFIVKKCHDSVARSSESDDSVVVQNPRRGDVLVAGGGHNALMSNVIETPLASFNWLAGTPPWHMQESESQHVEDWTVDQQADVAGSTSGYRKKIYHLQIRHLQEPKPCTLSVVPTHRVGSPSVDFTSNAASSMIFDESIGAYMLRIELCHDSMEKGELPAGLHENDDLSVKVDKRNRTESRLGSKSNLQAATPGQIVALYDGDVCLGGGSIVRAYMVEEPR